jgi:hypothetical protein
MADNTKVITSFPVANSMASTDQVLVIRDPAGTPATRLVSVGNLLGNSAANVSLQFVTPANSTVTVTRGTVFIDADYIYVAVANNTLKRAALSSF